MREKEKVSVALVGVENPGNLGAVARIMKNFGVKRLFLVDPQCDPNDEEARKRAMHGIDILEGAIILDSIKDLRRYTSFLIATSAKVGRGIPARRIIVYPEELAFIVRRNPFSYTIVFGRESSGLTNEEILECDLLLHIPASSEYPVLNLSHAVGVVLYVLYREGHGHYDPYLDRKLAELLKVVDKICCSIPEKVEARKKIILYGIRGILAKALLHEHDINTLFAFLRGVERLLDQDDETTLFREVKNAGDADENSNSPP